VPVFIFFSPLAPSVPPRVRQAVTQDETTYASQSQTFPPSLSLPFISPFFYPSRLTLWDNTYQHKAATTRQPYDLSLSLLSDFILVLPLCSVSFSSFLEPLSTQSPPASRVFALLKPLSLFSCQDEHPLTLAAPSPATIVCEGKLYVFGRLRLGRRPAKEGDARPTDFAQF